MQKDIAIDLPLVVRVVFQIGSRDALSFACCLVVLVARSLLLCATESVKARILLEEEVNLGRLVLRRS